MNRLLENIVAAGSDPKDVEYLLITHCHFDHTGGARSLRDRLELFRYFNNHMAARLIQEVLAELAREGLVTPYQLKTGGRGPPATVLASDALAAGRLRRGHRRILFALFAGLCTRISELKPKK